MKNLSKFFFLFVLATISITSCSKSEDNNDDWAEEQRRINRARIEALLKEQAPILEDFAKTHFGEDAQFDDSTGIWFKIHEPGEEGSYTYRVVPGSMGRSEEHTSELQSRENLVCRLLLENRK